MIRAFLLARATVALFFPRRATNDCSYRLRGLVLRPGDLVDLARGRGKKYASKTPSSRKTKAALGHIAFQVLLVTTTINATLLSADVALIEETFSGLHARAAA